jgi:Tol biopolymer transport system component
MKKKPNKFYLLLSIITLISSCSLPNSYNTPNLKSNKLSTSNINNLQIKGKVEFPSHKTLSKGGLGGLKTKATLQDIAPQATVSLIYPHDHATLANKTAATGLTDNDGNFTINPDTNLNIPLNAIYVLEAVKRLGNIGNDLITVRTFIKWNGASWDSITNTGISINAYTTAVAAITSLKNIDPDLTIGKIDNSTLTNIPLDIYSNKITFTSDRDGNTQVYLMDTNGANVQRLNNDGFIDSDGTLSPNGKKFAFVSVTDNKKAIYIANLDGSNETQITPNYIYCGTPRWSPDGTKILFPAQIETDTEIYTVSTDGNNLTKLTFNKNEDDDPTWSFDGLNIVFSSNRDGNFEIYKMDAEGKNQVRLTNNPADEIQPNYSTDGSKIVFASNRLNSLYQLYTINSDGSNETALSSTNYHELYPFYSYDNSKIIFQSGESSNSQIYSMDANGANIVNISNTLTNEGLPNNNNNVILASEVNKVTTIVSNLLANNVDAIRFLDFKQNQYTVLKEPNHRYNEVSLDNSCPNCDFSNEDLKTLSFINSNLTYANFSNSNLKTANFTNSDLSNANFTNSDLTNTIFSGANLTNTNLNLASSLSNTNFTNAIMPNITLANKTLTFFKGSGTNLSGANLSSSNFTSGNFNNSNLTNANLSSSNLLGATFTGTNLTNTNFVNATWTDGTICHSTLSIGTCAPTIGEFKANTYTTSSQTKPVVASDANNNYLVVWESNGQDGDGLGIYAQRYNSRGLKLGSEFRVNTTTVGNQSNPTVAMRSNGSFVISWVGDDGDGTGIFAKKYNSNGAVIDTEFLVNSNTTNSQTTPSLAINNTNGNFVITWDSFTTDGDENGIFAKTFDSLGNTLVDDFPINSYTTGKQITPKVAADNNDNFVVTWNSNGQDGDSEGIFIKKFTMTSNTSISGEFQVNSYTTSSQINPTIAMKADSNFIISWQSSGQDGDLEGIYAQRVDSNVNALGSEFQVNSYTTSSQVNPSVAMKADGSFIISWQSLGQDGDLEGIYAQRFDSSGVLSGSEFQVNTYTTSNQAQPAITIDSLGDFIIVWSSDLQDTALEGIFGKKYNSNAISY